MVDGGGSKPFVVIFYGAGLCLTVGFYRYFEQHGRE